MSRKICNEVKNFVFVAVTLHVLAYLLQEIITSQCRPCKIQKTIAARTRANIVTFCAHLQILSAIEKNMLSANFIFVVSILLSVRK